MFLGGFTDSLCLWLASGSRKLSDPHRDPHRRGSRDETDKDTQKAVAQLRCGEFLPEFLGNLKVVGNPMTMMMMMNDNDDNRINDNSLERERERRRERERKKTSYNDDDNSNKYLIVNLILVFISWNDPDRPTMKWPSNAHLNASNDHQTIVKNIHQHGFVWTLENRHNFPMDDHYFSFFRNGTNLGHPNMYKTIHSGP